MMNPAPLRRATGFTLIEVLVAIAVFAILSVLAYGSLGNLLDTRTRLDSEREFWRDLALVYVRLGDDLAHARARPVRDNSGFPLPAFRGQPVDPRALGEPSLEFTRGGEFVYGPAIRSDLRRVAYQLREGVLYRLTWPVLDRAPLTKPVEQVLLRDVEEFELQFLDAGGGQHQSWPLPTGGAPLPRAIEAKMAVKGRIKLTRLFLVNG